MKNEIVNINAPELEGVETSRAVQIKEIFAPMAEKLLEFEGQFSDIVKRANGKITEKVCKDAKKLRTSIAKVRTNTDKIRKAEKDKHLVAGRAIDGVANILKWAVSDKEKELLVIEKYFETIERERLDKLQEERFNLLSKYVEDQAYIDLSEMEEDVWKNYLNSKRITFEEVQEARRIAEEKRIEKEKANAEERERMKKENEELKKKAIETEKLQKIEAKKRAKEQEEHEAEINKQRVEREKIQAKLKAKEDEERKKKLEVENAKQAELSKGDEDKRIDLIGDLKNMKICYSFKSEKNRKMYCQVGLLIDKILNHIEV